MKWSFYFFEIHYTLLLSYDLDNIVCYYGEHRTQWYDNKTWVRWGNTPCAITYFVLYNIQNSLEHLGALYSISHLIVFTKIQDYWKN
jgi:hypothetical protein